MSHRCGCHWVGTFVGDVRKPSAVGRRMEAPTMMNDNELADKLLQQDSSAYMDGSHNWVLDAHPEDPERRGKITTHVPWQAWYLLADAAARLRELSAQSVLLNSVAWALAEATGRVGPDDDRATLDDSPLGMVRELSAENERLRIAIVEHQAANATPHCDDDACPRGCGNDRKLYAAIDNP